MVKLARNAAEAGLRAAGEGGARPLTAEGSVTVCPRSCGGTLLTANLAVCVCSLLLVHVVCRRAKVCVCVRLQEHLKGQCPNRMETCDTCGEVMTAQERSYHSPLCGKCDWCGAACTSEIEKEGHKTAACPNRLVQCDECDLLEQYGGIPARCVHAAVHHE